VLLDHQAMNTLDNLVFARELVAQSFAEAHELIVCCDIAHALKAWILARLVLRGRVRMLAVPRRVPLRVWLREPLSIVFETLGAIVPLLRPLLSRGAAWMKGVRVERLSSRA
jgi:hypothetical protein